MISEKRRREILRELGEDARQFAEGWRLASAYGKAGDTKMRDFFMNSIMQPSRLPHTAEEKAWLKSSFMEQASKRLKEIPSKSIS